MVENLLFLFFIQNTEPDEGPVVEKGPPAIESCSSPPAPPDFVHDELVEGNANLIGNHNDDLLFENPLPEQLFQSDEKDGDGDSNSVDDLNQKPENPTYADGDNVQQKNQVKTDVLTIDSHCEFHCYSNNESNFSFKKNHTKNESFENMLIAKCWCFLYLCKIGARIITIIGE